MNLQDLLNRTIDVILARRFAVDDLDWEGTPGNSEAGGLTIEIRKLTNKRHQALSNIRSNKLTFSAFMVADVTINFRSRRLDNTKEVCSTSEVELHQSVVAHSFEVSPLARQYSRTARALRLG